jgi:sulfofructose kinase
LADDRTARVICVGLATLDAIVELARVPGSDERLPAIDGILAGGGGAATAAVALARLGVPVAFAGCVGDDDAGRLIRDGLARETVDVSFLRSMPGPSAFSVALVEHGSGARSIVPVAGSAGSLDVDEALAAACSDAAWIHVDHIGFAAVEALRHRGVQTPVSVDAGNPIPHLSLAAIDLYAPTEAQLLARYASHDVEGASRRAIVEGARTVVVTRGARGAIAATRSGDGTDGVAFESAAAPRLPVVSTLGAGDVFHGALIAALVDARSLRDALRFANAAAALSCAALDGRTAIPTRAELDRFLAENDVAFTN